MTVILPHASTLCLFFMLLKSGWVESVDELIEPVIRGKSLSTSVRPNRPLLPVNSGTSSNSEHATEVTFFPSPLQDTTFQTSSPPPENPTNDIRSLTQSNLEPGAYPDLAGLIQGTPLSDGAKDTSTSSQKVPIRMESGPKTWETKDEAPRNLREDAFLRKDGFYPIKKMDAEGLKKFFFPYTLNLARLWITVGRSRGAKSVSFLNSSVRRNWKKEAKDLTKCFHWNWISKIPPFSHYLEATKPLASLLENDPQIAGLNVEVFLYIHFVRWQDFLSRLPVDRLNLPPSFFAQLFPFMDRLILTGGQSPVPVFEQILDFLQKVWHQSPEGRTEREKLACNSYLLDMFSRAWLNRYSKDYKVTGTENVLGDVVEPLSIETHVARFQFKHLLDSIEIFPFRRPKGGRKPNTDEKAKHFRGISALLPGLLGSVRRVERATSQESPHSLPENDVEAAASRTRTQALELMGPYRIGNGRSDGLSQSPEEQISIGHERTSARDPDKNMRMKSGSDQGVTEVIQPPSQKRTIIDSGDSLVSAGEYLEDIVNPKRQKFGEEQPSNFRQPEDKPAESTQSEEPNSREEKLNSPSPVSVPELPHDTESDQFHSNDAQRNQGWLHNILYHEDCDFPPCLENQNAGSASMAESEVPDTLAFWSKIYHSVNEPTD